ncbi:hypothetical protein SODALDRAFT_321486 [Sodiomyces alkalinus F11]|uniref:Uncharacterized protein n=1 Tax=Sodiomyces alkalinus (strain CBS 110278 / VKM F-3762 / F11) TaxID=1314773 RepID=A0A3N2PIV1_SODAK|nr:hypothetical protein SODALDRAFT_321486 [Sodiomyces alkalinus F11]ROT34477.1 hypothetical protein SODALDRAFT_321486 [Sodiomyces alkalinus F11]
MKQFALFAAFISTAFACRPIFDEDYYGGMRPMAACWLMTDILCETRLNEDVGYLILPEERVIVATNLHEWCINMIIEEKAREEDGRLTYGWLEEHGNLTLVGNTLVITNAEVEMYQRLMYKPCYGWPYEPPCNDKV